MAGRSKTLVSKICQFCKTNFVISGSDAKRGRGTFCSRDCGNRARIGRSPARQDVTRFAPTGLRSFLLFPPPLRVVLK